MSEKPPSDVPLPYADRPVATAPGHWVLARAGKRVLRPGGAALTAAMLAPRIQSVRWSAPQRRVA